MLGTDDVFGVEWTVVAHPLGHRVPAWKKVCTTLVNDASTTARGAAHGAIEAPSAGHGNTPPPPHVWRTSDASNSGAMQDNGEDEVAFCACAPRNTPPHFIENVMKIVVRVY